MLPESNEGVLPLSDHSQPILTEDNWVCFSNKILLEDGVGEVVIVIEFEADDNAAGVTSLGINLLGAHGDLEALDIEALQLGEDVCIVGSDVAINIGGRLLEDERPEVLDLGDDLLTLSVEGSGANVLLGHCMNAC